MEPVGILGAWNAILVVVLGGGVGLPLGIPPTQADPLLAKVAPDECLYYTTWAGMSTPDSDSTNQVEQLLAEPEVQQMLKQIEQEIVAALKRAAAEEGEQAELAAQLVPELVKKLITRPTALFVSDFQVGSGAPDISAAMIVNLGDEAADVTATLEKLQASLLGPAVKSIDLAGRDAYRIQPDPNAPAVVWARLGRYLIAGVGEEAVEGVVTRAGTEAPGWLVNLKQNLTVERPSTMSYINVKKLVEKFAPLGGLPVAAVIRATGLGEVKSLSSVTGLEGTGYVGRTLLELEGEPSGLVQILAQKPLAREDLAPIPSDSTLALAVRLDAEQVFELFLNTVEQVEPRARGEIMEGIAQMNNQLGIDVRGDILASLGDVWCAYNSPREGGLILTGLTATVTVKNRDRLLRAHDRLLEIMKAEMRGPDGSGHQHRGPQLKEIEVAGQKVYVLTGIDDDVPLAPSWCLTEKHFVVALFPQHIKAFLKRNDDYQSLDAAPEVAGLLADEKGPSLLFYQDTPELFKLGYPLLQMFAAVASHDLQREGVDLDVSLLPSVKAILPHLRPGVSFVRRTEAGIEFETRQSFPGGNIGATLPLAAAVGIPAVGTARMAAGRTHSMNNLKQLAIAMHAHHDSMGQFPPAYIADKDGKPLLSWRVRILPYIEQQPLYDQFHLDEPWDSEHNKKLLEIMPDTYRSRGSKPGPGKTHYLTVRGKDTIFPGKDPVRMAAVRDGTSNTIMIVEAGDSSVPWTKPDDFEYDPDNPTRGLIGELRGDGFNAALADGSVRFISSSVAKEMLVRLFNKADGEVVELP